MKVDRRIDDRGVENLNKMEIKRRKEGEKVNF